MRPSLSTNAALIISTSRCANPARELIVSAGLRLSQLLSTENVSPSLKMTARSMTFCNSRMFPGQSYALNSASVSLLMCLMFLPAFFEKRPTK